MKVTINIVSLLFSLTLLFGCSAEDNVMDAPQSPLDKTAQVVLTLSVPEVSLPLTSRAISDDKAIDNFVLWAFDNNNQYLYQLDPKDKDEKGNPKVIIRGNKVYALLPESETEVTLVMIANNEAQEPALRTSKEVALASLKFQFSESLSHIPMYGESISFIVKEGATPGAIRLVRALARIEVDASNAWPLFDLQSVEVVNVNTEGTVVKSTTISNTNTRKSFSSTLTNDASSHNQWKFYIPEATSVDSHDPNIRTSLILKGVNKEKQTRYYRIDFIKRIQESGSEIKYEYIKSIERNHRYVFRIEHILASAGSETRDEALAKERADNGIIYTTLMVIKDEEIRDITTDNEFYLGITWSQIEASIKPDGDKKYYTANMSIATNNPEGWKIDDKPDEIDVSAMEWKASGSEDREQTTSVWMYIEKSKVTVGDQLELYVYSGNIRKTVRITIL